MRGIISAFATENPKLAASLTDSHNGDLTDCPVAEFVSNSLDTDPQGAVSRIALIHDAAQQERMYRDSLKQWMQNNKPTAIDWFNSNTLPPNLIDHLNRKLQSQQDNGN
jgi:hypothetical protein